MLKWEYLVVVVDGETWDWRDSSGRYGKVSESRMGIAALLNSLGEQGWELASTVLDTTANPHGKTVLYLKRVSL